MYVYIYIYMCVRIAPGRREAVPRGGKSPTMTSCHEAGWLDRYLTEFVAEKRTVIRSKSLRIPEKTS